MDNQNTTLEQQIKTYIMWKDAYYNGEPIVSDEVFDALEETLVEKGYDPKVGIVDMAIDDRDKVEHGQKMLSLGKKKVLQMEMDLSMAEDIFNNYGCGNLSWKYDGMAINIRYSSGKLISASTRGNGNFGRNVMYKLKNLLPKTISELNDVELRFEAVMKNSTFKEKYSNYSHPRNLVAGIFADITETDIRINDVDLVLLEAIDTEIGVLLNIDEFTEFTNHKLKYQVSSAEELKSAFDHCSISRSEYDYGTDGMVYTSNEFDYFTHNGHHPDHAIAIKFMPPVLISTIEKIVWNLQRTGAHKPIIYFTPFVIDGRTIRKASGYNMKYLIDNDLCEGKQVNVFLSNDIIPMVKPIKA